MISADGWRLPRTFGAVLAFPALLAAVSCQPHQTPAAATAASAGSPSSDPTLRGPCDQFVDEVCGRVGKQSNGCRTVTASAELLSPAACEAAKMDVSYTVQRLGAQRKLCDVLAAKLCAEIGERTETCQMIAVQTRQFPAERCSMMMEHFPEVLESVKAIEAQNAPLTPQVQSAIAAGDAPSFGPPDAKVTIVQFSDFQCPYCSKAAEVTRRVKQKYSAEVRFVFRQFPFDFHEQARLAAEASLAAHAEGKFWPFHDKLFDNQGALGREDLEKYAEEVGLDVEKFKKALDDSQYSGAVDADLDLGSDASVQGTPSMFLNGKRVKDPTDFAAVSRLIDAALGG